MLNDKYADKVITNPDLYCWFEVEAMVQVGEPDDIAVWIAYPGDPVSFYSVFARKHTGYADAVGDFETIDLAIAYAHELQALYGYPVKVRDTSQTGGHLYRIDETAHYRCEG